MLVFLSDLSGEYTLYVCEEEGTEITLCCQEGLKLNILYVNYGRTVIDPLVCPYWKRHTNRITCNEYKDTLLKNAKKYCDGHRNCSFDIRRISEAAFLSCPDTHKYTEVKYQCVP